MTSVPRYLVVLRLGVGNVCAVPSRSCQAAWRCVQAMHFIEYCVQLPQRSGLACSQHRAFGSNVSDGTRVSRKCFTLL